MSVRVDIPGALRIALAAAEFDWTWSARDITRFAAAVGWSEPAPDDEDSSVIYVVTDLDHEDPIAMFGIDEHGEIILATVLLANLPLRRPAAALADTVAALLPHLGPSASPAHDDGTGAAWVRPRVVLKVSGGETVELVLQNPARWHAPEQERLREITSEHERAGEEFLEHLNTVIGSNLGDRLGSESGRSKLRDTLNVFGRRSGRGIWSQRDIDDLYEAFRARPDDMGEGSLMAVHESGLGLIAAKTYENQERYGYGEYCELRYVAFVPPETADSFYRRALAVCVERLGDPHMVGGPNAFALWRFEDDTIKLTRTLDSDARLHVSLKPTQPSDWEQRVNPQSDPEFEPPDLWRGVPDTQYSGPALAGLLFSPGEDADDWMELYKMLRAVFASLAADVPVLHRYTSDISWSIAEADEAGFLARGQFSPDGCTVETMIHGRTHTQRFPPGGSNGIEMAELTMDAVEAANLNSPADLRYSARATQAPHQIMDAHFGLEEADDDAGLSPSQWRGRPQVEHAYVKSETTYEIVDGELHEISRVDFDPPKRAR
ncbi:hypothetical protein GFY24_04330 [Nocardia sp. SYP-A9097]|uniref:DUF6301 family protein n=1 Tax=Nocardia sp. SYP-A9097 TaxID=2663237 RepID=UPI00129BF376|nr:DUF6301 family protein [Nocardia sp. SYP-A9097]MRH86702.1 hypothetical protein [Nocardia sp. SYP-A9097]